MSDSLSDADHILVIDDDPAMCEMITGYFQKYDIAAKSVSTRREFDSSFTQNPPDLIIMDMQLGEDDGLHLLRDIRAQSDVPIIVATDYGHHDLDPLVYLDLDVDDYIGKPFCLTELSSRLRNILRRQGAAARTKRLLAPLGRSYAFGGWRLECHSRRLFNAEGNPVALTNGEFGLLRAFLKAPQQALTRTRLVQAIEACADDSRDCTVELHVLRLRRKLEAEPNAPRLIMTVKGVGYLFALPVETL
ncbi:MAG: response regulator [Dongiaceae bacterium]